MALTEKQIESALRNAGGFVSHAAKQLGVTHQAVSKRIKQSAKLSEIRKEIDESYLDLAESKLIKNINAGDNASIFFYLKCKGKNRGYVEKQILDINNVTEKDDKELRRELNQLLERGKAKTSTSDSDGAEKA